MTYATLFKNISFYDELCACCKWLDLAGWPAGLGPGTGWALDGLGLAWAGLGLGLGWLGRLGRGWLLAGDSQSDPGQD